MALGVRFWAWARKAKGRAWRPSLCLSVSESSVNEFDSEKAIQHAAFRVLGWFYALPAVAAIAFGASAVLPWFC